MKRIERLLEWTITWWGHATTKMMWSDWLLLRALGLVMALAGITVVGLAVGAYALVFLVKKRCSAKSASCSETHPR